MGRKLHDADDGRQPRCMVGAYRGSRFAEDIRCSTAKDASHAALGAPRGLRLGPVRRALAYRRAPGECARGLAVGFGQPIADVTIIVRE